MQPLSLITARVSVLLVFFVHGAVFSTWVSRIPDVQSGLGLSTGALGFALLGIAAGSLISLPATGWLIARYGSKPLTITSSLWFCAALIPPAWAGTGLWLGIALCGIGLSAGAMDVSMNAQGVAVERLARKPMMSGFHAMFSIGGMAGAAAGGLVAKAGVPVRQHFCWAAVAYLVVILLVCRWLAPASADASAGGRSFRFTSAIAGLGVIAFCFFLSEGAMADWSAIYLSRSLGAGPALSAGGYAVFSAAMATGRVAGDPLRSRFGSVGLVRCGSVVAAAGMILALIGQDPLLGLAGFALVGFGCSVIVPIAFAASGNAGGGPGIAAVATIGYFGMFVGPPVVGVLAEATSLRYALWIIPALCLSGVVLARVAQVPVGEGHTLSEEAASTEHPKSPPLRLIS